MENKKHQKDRFKIWYIIGLISLTLCFHLNQGLFVFQRVMMFKFKRNVEIEVFEKIKDQDNQDIDIYLFDKGSDTDFLFIHGSIASGKVFKETLEKMAEKTKCNVIGYYMRGMNNKRGQSSEKGMMEEALLVGDFVKSRGKKMVVYGQSLGCSVALSLANYLGIEKVILENPFVSFETVLKKKKLLGWFYYLTIDKWNNLERVKKHNGKLFILASENDKLVSNDNSSTLADSHRCSKIQILKGNTHFDAQKNVNYHQYICDFIY